MGSRKIFRRFSGHKFDFCPKSIVKSNFYSPIPFNLVTVGKPYGAGLAMNFGGDEWGATGLGLPQAVPRISNRDEPTGQKATEDNRAERLWSWHFFCSNMWSIQDLGLRSTGF